LKQIKQKRPRGEISLSRVLTKLGNDPRLLIGGVVAGGNLGREIA